jgi:hypothetical protein
VRALQAVTIDFVLELPFEVTVDVLGVLLPAHGLRDAQFVAEQLLGLLAAFQLLCPAHLLKVEPADLPELVPLF